MEKNPSAFVPDEPPADYFVVTKEEQEVLAEALSTWRGANTNTATERQLRLAEDMWAALAVQ